MKDIKNPLQSVWPFIKTLDWSEGSYSIDKSYVCALFSQFAYLIIPEFELKNNERVKIIPCENYQEIIRSGGAFNHRVALIEADFGEYFIIIRRYAVVLGVKTPGFVAVAIRGTKPLYDWMINLNAKPVTIDNNREFFRFHRGFFRAAQQIFDPLYYELSKIIKEPVPIYVTGHSLGGALSAIIYGLWEEFLQSKCDDKIVCNNILEFHSSYTFGMPRFANMETLSMLRTPYHMYNSYDIVPDLPPKWMGFESCSTEYRLDGKNLRRASRSGGREFGAWITCLALGKGITEHSMELYRARIEECVSRA